MAHLKACLEGAGDLSENANIGSEGSGKAFLPKGCKMAANLSPTLILTITLTERLGDVRTDKRGACRICQCFDRSEAGGWRRRRDLEDRGRRLSVDSGLVEEAIDIPEPNHNSDLARRRNVFMCEWEKEETLQRLLDGEPVSDVFLHEYLTKFVL